jgi:hypothetical protein
MYRAEKATKQPLGTAVVPTYFLGTLEVGSKQEPMSPNQWSTLAGYNNMLRVFL